jgi:hypothetical protein
MGEKLIRTLRRRIRTGSCIFLLSQVRGCIKRMHVLSTILEVPALKSRFADPDPQGSASFGRIRIRIRNFGCRIRILGYKIGI